eukprot:5332302-Amphidinium_carterae.1
MDVKGVEERPATGAITACCATRWFCQWMLQRCRQWEQSSLARYAWVHRGGQAPMAARTGCPSMPL